MPSADLIYSNWLSPTTPPFCPPVTRQTSFQLLTDPTFSSPPRTPSTLPGECPKGVAWADDATGVDSAHKGAVPGVTGVMCSNKGICDLSNGVCTCQVGYEGMACHRSK